MSLWVVGWRDLEAPRAATKSYERTNLDEDAPPPDVPRSWVRALPYRSLGRSVYLFSTSQDVNAPLPEPEVGPFWIRRPFHGLGRNPYVFSTIQDETAPPVGLDPPSTHWTRLQFKPYYRSRYLFTQARDPSATLESDSVGSIVYRKFRSLGRNPYTWSSTQDESIVQPDAGAAFQVQREFLTFAPNKYRFSLSQDISVPPEPDSVGSIVRASYKPLGKNPYVWSPAQDFDAPIEPDTAPTFIARQMRNFSGVHASHLLNLGAPTMDTNAPPPIYTGPFVPVRYVVGIVPNVVPVVTISVAEIGAVPVREVPSIANVVPVREVTSEKPHVRVYKV